MEAIKESTITTKNHFTIQKSVRDLPDFLSKVSSGNRKILKNNMIMKKLWLAVSFVLLLFQQGVAQEETNPFITSWSVIDGDEVTIPVNTSFTYDFDYVWKSDAGDTLFSTTGATGDIVQAFTTADTVTLEITGAFPHFQDYPKDQLLDVEQWGDIVWESFAESFDSWVGESFSATDAPDLTQVTDFTNLFNEASSFNGDLSNWNVSNVNTFERAFREADAFTGESISGWITSSATDMSFMFAAADNFNGDISGWEVGDVTDMNRLFNLATNFNADLSGWNVENVTDMLRMFRSTSFDQDISGWDVGKVTTMDEMFSGSSLSRTNYENLLIGWSAITDLQTNVDFDAGGNQACLAEAEIARSVLINDFGWNISDNGICDEATDILSFEIGDEQIGETVIDFENHTITLEAFLSVDISSLVPVFILSEGAISDLAGDVVQDFTNPVTYTITAEDEATQQEWVVTISNSDVLSTITDILSFQFSGISAGISIDNDNHEIQAFIAPGNTLTSLTPTFTLSTGANSAPTSGVAQDFTNAVIYTVTAEDGTTLQEWTVTVEEFAPFVTSWNVSADDEITIPLNSSFSYDFSYVWKDVDGLIVSSGSHTSDEGDFSTTFVNAGTYSLEIYSSFPHFQNYPKNQLVDVTQWGDIVWESFNQTFSSWTGSTFSATDAPILSSEGVSFFRIFRQSNFGGDISHWDVSNVTAVNEAFQTARSFNSDVSSWNLSLPGNYSSMFANASAFEGKGLDQWNIENVTSFNNAFNGTAISTSTYDDMLINWSGQDVNLGVRFGASGIEACDGEVARAILTNNFGWNISDGGTCDVATNILSFEIADEQVGETIIDFENHTITLEVFSDADVTSLTPTITLSEGASSEPATDAIQDFTNPVTYTVTAEDGVTTQDWTVDVQFIDQSPFITSWSTVTGESITIELDGSYDYNFNYTWKDTDGNEITTGRHTSADGDFVTPFTTTEEVSLEITGNFPYLTTDYPKDQLLDVVQWGGIVWESFESSFEDWTGTSFSATDAPDLSQVTSLSEMFLNASNFNADLNEWNMSNITDMGSMFRFASSFNSDISGWVVNSVTTMGSMFQGAESFNIDISGWNVSSVTNMGVMFSEARVFNQNIGDWEVGNVTNMSRMFRNADAFTQDLNQWDVSNVTTMGEMFLDANSFNGNVGTWNVESVTNMSGMFENADAFNQNLDEWNVGNVTNMSFMFNDNGGFNGNIGTWNVENVTDMEAMFDNADSFNRDLDEWNVSNVTDMSFMFQNNGGFNGNIGTWKVDSVTTMFRMFENAGAFNQDLTHWNPVSLTNMQRMFRNANSFNGDMSTWNVESVTNMAQIFNEADSFDQDLSAWDVSNAGTMTNIFENSGLSGQNYDKILIAWAALPDLNEDISLDAEGVTFCKAVEAKTTLEALGWIITDDGSFCLDETDILSFEFEEGLFDSEIDATAHTVQAFVTFDAGIASLSPFITLSPGATVAPDSEEVVNFTDTVEYIVTAEDGVTTETWTVNVLSQPANDLCTGAITVNVDDVVTGNTTFATNDANIASNCGSNFVDDGSVGVWYRFVGNGETITLNTCTGDKYEFDDTSMSVYTGSCSEGLSCLTGNEDAGIEDECGGSGFQARLSFNSEIGADYFILVDGFGDNSGEFDLSITSEPTLPPPANDNCEEAEILTVFADGAGTPTEGTNANATAFTRLVECDEFVTINDVWYTFNSGSNTQVSIDIALTDTDEDGELVAAGFINYELYDDCDGEGLDICESDGTSIIDVTPNTDYWLQLWNNTQSEGTFTIQLNDGPNTAAGLSFENADANTIDISRFAETGIQIDSVIADDAEGHAQVFSITAGNEEGIFTIDAESGAITIADAALLSASITTSFSLTILSEDQGPGEVTSEITLTVDVIDNAPPVVTDEAVSVDENTLNGTLIATFQTSDPDGDSVFPVDASTDPEGILEVDEDGNISVLDESLLDFEVNPSITVTFTVEDDGPLGLEAKGTITVNLNDVNEAPALADTTFSISQFSANGFSIGTIPFTDEDAGQTHNYAILDDGDNDGSIFSIDANTGELTVIDETQLSANGEITYTFDVEVTDDVDEPLSGTATVTINTFGNNPPVITAETFTVNENTANDSRVGVLEAVDADDDNIEFSLESETSVFAVASDGEITVADSEALDFESNASFELLVGATDDGIGTLKSTQTIFITLNDINEVPEITSASFDISSSSADGSTVGQVEAEDQDGDALSYKITSGNEEDIYAIGSTGILSIVDASLLDPFTTPQYVLTVEVNDGGLKASAEFTINVFLNTAPELTPISFSIDENNESGALIGIMEATDSDGIESLEITSGNDEGIFELNEATGELSIINDVIFDFEETQSYQLGVTATDNGLGNVSTTEIVTISVNDINEFDPVISEVNGGTVDENSEAGTVVASVIASDDDTFQTLAYSIISGNEEGIFAIDENGEITTTAEIDFEQNPNFSLSVEVSDDVDPVRTTSETVSINISDVNETPVLEAIDAIISSVESEITFTVVSTDPENDELIYSFEESTAQDGMTIDETTGAFSWTPTADQLGSFDLTIVVSDAEFDVSETVSFTILNNATDILAFDLEEQTGDAIINTTDHTVAIEVAFGTDITELAPELTLSQGATSDPLSEEVIVDFTNAVTYTVTAEDEITIQDWTVTVTEAPNTETDILSFVLEEQTGNAIINATDHTIDIEVAFGTDVTTLAPTITISEGATSNPVSGGTVDFTGDVTYTVTAEDGTTTQEWIVTVTEAPNTATDILTFALAEQTSAVAINATAHTIAIEVAFGTDVTTLVPTITLSEGGSISPATGEVQDFTNAVTYTVTAEDATTTQDWIVTVTIDEEEPDTDTDILTFVLAEQTSAATINATAHTVAIEVAFGTDVTTLVPAITLSEGATSDPASGVVVDFTNAVTYTVTAEDGITTQDWIVTVTIDEEEPDTDTDILTFVLAEQTSAATINATTHTVAIEVAFGTDVTTLVPTITLSEGATSDPASGVAVDFTNAVNYTVTAEDATTTQDWIVTVTIDEEAPDTDTDILTFVLAEQTSAATINATAHTVAIEVAVGTDVTTLVPTLTLSEGATSDPASGATVDFTNAVTYTVTAEDGITTQNWTVTVTIDDEEPDTDTDILTFVLAEQTSAATINATAHTVAIEVASGTDVATLVPTLTLSEGATTDPASGATVDFTNAVTYTVTAEDGTTTQDWIVTVTEDAEEPDTDTDILTFVLAEQTSAATINATAHTVAIEVASGTDVATLVPTLTLSEGATSDPASGATVDFTNAVTYTVTAEDGITTQNWTVTVTIDEEEPDTDTDILTFVLAEQTSAATINATAHTVAIEVAVGTDVTTLVPTLTLSEGATSDPASGATVDFTNAVTYTVTAEDGITTQNWTVTVEVEETPLALDRDPGLQIYPNPVTERLFVRTLEKSNVSLIDLNGRILIREQGSEIEMDVSQLKSGTYLLIVQSGDIVTKRKIIKSN